MIHISVPGCPIRQAILLTTYTILVGSIGGGFCATRGVRCHPGRLHCDAVIISSIDIKGERIYQMANGNNIPRSYASVSHIPRFTAEKLEAAQTLLCIGTAHVDQLPVFDAVGR